MSNEALSDVCTLVARFTTCLDRISLASIPRTGRASCAITWTSPHSTASPLQISCTRTRKECSPERSLVMRATRSGTMSGRHISSRSSQQATRLMTHSISVRLNWQRYVIASSRQRFSDAPSCAHNELKRPTGMPIVSAQSRQCVHAARGRSAVCLCLGANIVGAVPATNRTVLP